MCSYYHKTLYLILSWAYVDSLAHQVISYGEPRLKLTKEFKVNKFKEFKELTKEFKINKFKEFKELTSLSRLKLTNILVFLIKGILFQSLTQLKVKRNINNVQINFSFPNLIIIFH